MTAIAPTERSNQLFSEIKEMYDQYLKEVPKKRRPWPLSIKKRVNELRSLGISTHEIARITNLPAPTMYSWRSREPTPKFVPVKLVKEKHHTITHQLSQLDIDRKSGTPLTVTVVLPNGVRLEGLDANSALKLGRAY